MVATAANSYGAGAAAAAVANNNNATATAIFSTADIAATTATAQ